MKQSTLPLATALILLAILSAPALLARPAADGSSLGLYAGSGDPSTNKIKVVKRERRKKDLRLPNGPSEPAGASWGGWFDASSPVD